MTTPLTEERLAEIEARQAVNFFAPEFDPVACNYDRLELLAEVKRLRPTPANQPNGEGELWVDICPSQLRAIINKAVQECAVGLDGAAEQYEKVAAGPDDFLEVRARAERSAKVAHRCAALVRLHLIPEPAHPQSQEGV